MNRISRVVTLVAVAVALAACSSPSQQASTAIEVPPVPTVANGPMQPAPPPGTPANGAFGPGCASLPLSDQPGALGNIARQPVAAAVDGSPELSTLADAISTAGLTARLNAAPGLTLFAPTNAAFEKLPPADLQALLNDRTRLTQVLGYHVVGTRETADQLRRQGAVTATAGGQMLIGGTGTTMTVTDGAGTTATVTCANVTTLNATVFLLDTVLTPGS